MSARLHALTANRRARLTAPPAIESRVKLVTFFLLGVLGLVILRLGYWQIVKHSELTEQAEAQYRKTKTFAGARGSIYTADNFLLATNEPRYRLFAQPNRLRMDSAQLTKDICSVLSQRQASASAQIDCGTILEKLSKTDSHWQTLALDITQEERTALSEKISDPAVGFEEFHIRTYPEASTAAQLLGFVGKTEDGDPIGQYGIEGLLENELKGKIDAKTVLTDALGYQLTADGIRGPLSLQGRDIVLTVRRDIQHSAETMLADAVKQYGAKSGEVIIMEPKTGNILALANYPTFKPSEYVSTDPQLYGNSSLVDTYEPGSTLKILTVSAGINEGVISPSTACTRCAGPRVVYDYTIRTWNDVYTPGITMVEALEKSDNTAMIYVSDLLGSQKLEEYTKKFRIGQPIGIDLQGDTSTPFPERWGPVETATISFGQGIVTTPLQLVRAVGAIANNGVIVNPRIVLAIKDEEKVTELPPTTQAEQIITEETAETVTQMMVSAAEHGEAKWAYAKNFRVAGKTGTSQVAVRGGYDEDKTIASFVGFSPPENPKFVMLVKIDEPTSSPWAAETAAPLWFKLANKLYLLLGIPYEDTASPV